MNRGYGHFYLGKRFVYAHRFAYALYVGPLAPGQRVFHRCGVPSCVNPEHLYVSDS